MTIRLSLVALCVALALSPVAAKDKIKSAAEQLACDGIFGPGSSEASLIAQFGAENVVTGMVYGAEGMEMLATTLFPHDPKRTMQIGWMDEQTRTDIAYVDLSPSQIAPGGVRLGMSVAEVAALNGKGFEISGFWWDYGGYANIESGALTELDGGCHLSMRFSPAEEYPEALDITPVAGEVEVPSDHSLLEALDVRLTVLSISYPYEDRS